MVTFSRTSQATRAGKSGLVVDGVDVVVQQFTREALSSSARASAVVVTYAEKAANRMRATVPVDQGDLLDSISADRQATIEDGSVFAEAGPDLDENPAAFVARFIENGTVKMSPRPFAGPAADGVLPDFERAMRALSGL